MDDTWVSDIDIIEDDASMEFFPLFTNEKGAPITFSMYEGPEKDRIKSLLESNGGRMMSAPGGYHTVHLCSAGKRTISLYPTFSHKYVDDCIAHVQLLNLFDYRLDPGSAIPAMELMYVMLGVRTWQQVSSSGLFKTLCRPVVERRSSSSSSFSSDDESHCVNARVVQGNPNQRYFGSRRVDYSHEDRMAIVRYILKHNLASEVNGRRMWEEMASAKVCQSKRSWQSLKEHFRRKIVFNYLENMNIPLTDKLKLASKFPTVSARLKAEHKMRQKSRNEDQDRTLVPRASVASGRSRVLAGPSTEQAGSSSSTQAIVISMQTAPPVSLKSMQSSVGLEGLSTSVNASSNDPARTSTITGRPLSVSPILTRDSISVVLSKNVELPSQFSKGLTCSSVDGMTTLNSTASLISFSLSPSKSKSSIPSVEAAQPSVAEIPATSAIESQSSTPGARSADVMQGKMVRVEVPTISSSECISQHLPEITRPGSVPGCSLADFHASDRQITYPSSPSPAAIVPTESFSSSCETPDFFTAGGVLERSNKSHSFIDDSSSKKEAQSLKTNDLSFNPSEIACASFSHPGSLQTQNSHDVLAETDEASAQQGTQGQSIDSSLNGMLPFRACDVLQQTASLGERTLNEQDSVEQKQSPLLALEASFSSGCASPSAGLPSPIAGPASPSTGLPSPIAGPASPSTGLPSPIAGPITSSARFPSPIAAPDSSFLLCHASNSSEKANVANSDEIFPHEGDETGHSEKFCAASDEEQVTCRSGEIVGLPNDQTSDIFEDVELSENLFNFSSNDKVIHHSSDKESHCSKEEITCSFRDKVAPCSKDESSNSDRATHFGNRASHSEIQAPNSEGQATPSEEQDLPFSNASDCENQTHPFEDLSASSGDQTDVYEDQTTPGDLIALSEDQAVPSENQAVPSEDQAVPSEDQAAPSEDQAAPEDQATPSEDQIDASVSPVHPRPLSPDILLRTAVNQDSFVSDPPTCSGNVTSHSSQLDASGGHPISLPAEQTQICATPAQLPAICTTTQTSSLNNSEVGGSFPVVPSSLMCDSFSKSLSIQTATREFQDLANNTHLDSSELISQRLNTSNNLERAEENGLELCSVLRNKQADDTVTHTLSPSELFSSRQVFLITHNDDGTSGNRPLSDTDVILSSPESPKRTLRKCHRPMRKRSKGNPMQVDGLTTELCNREGVYHQPMSPSPSRCAKSDHHTGTSIIQASPSRTYELESTSAPSADDDSHIPSCAPSESCVPPSLETSIQSSSEPSTSSVIQKRSSELERNRQSALHSHADDGIMSSRASSRLGVADTAFASRERSSSSDSFSSFDLPSSSKVQNTGRRGKKFTSVEDMLILRFILDSRRQKEVGAKSMWEDMVRSMEGLKHRSWQSVKERYRKIIIKNIAQYNISAKERDLLNRGRDGSSQLGPGYAVVRLQCAPSGSVRNRSEKPDPLVRRSRSVGKNDLERNSSDDSDTIDTTLYSDDEADKVTKSRSVSPVQSEVSKNSRKARTGVLKKTCSLIDSDDEPNFSQFSRSTSRVTRRHPVGINNNVDSQETKCRRYLHSLTPRTLTPSGAHDAVASSSGFLPRLKGCKKTNLAEPIKASPSKFKRNAETLLKRKKRKTQE